MGCPNTAPCPTHTQRPGWTNSTRKHQLPPDWQQRRQHVLETAQGHCQCQGCPRCTGTPCTTPATDVDHIARGNDHSLTNLQALCTHCHRTKTAAEAAQARRTRRY